jgi:hypothetical protein
MRMCGSILAVVLCSAYAAAENGPRDAILPVAVTASSLHCLSNWQGERSGLAEIRFFTSGAGDKDAIAPGVQPVIRPLVKNRPNPPRRAVAGAENIVFPANSGIIDVTAAPYNAKGDGVTDDTRAIQQAPCDYPARGAIIYLPNGTYLLKAPSAARQWKPGPVAGKLEFHTSHWLCWRGCVDKHEYHRKDRTGSGSLCGSIRPDPRW